METSTLMESLDHGIDQADSSADFTQNTWSDCVTHQMKASLVRFHRNLTLSAAVVTQAKKSKNSELPRHAETPIYRSVGLYAVLHVSSFEYVHVRGISV